MQSKLSKSVRSLVIYERKLAELTTPTGHCKEGQ